MPSISIQESLATDFDLLESIKVLRTNILFSGSNVKTIALTSCHENEGKSTISLNLAHSIAQTGKRVILLDADLGKSVLYQRISSGSSADTRVNGLSHYLSGMASIEEILYKTDVPGLCVIFAGMLVTNSDALVGSEEFSTLVKALRNSFDYVIVDTPPLGQAVDCAVIAPVLDRVALVIDVTSNSYKTAKKVKKQLEQVGAKIIGVILNKVNFRHSGYYYGRYYGRYYRRYGRYNHYGVAAKQGK